MRKPRLDLIGDGRALEKQSKQTAEAEAALPRLEEEAVMAYIERALHHKPYAFLHTEIDRKMAASQLVLWMVKPKEPKKVRESLARSIGVKRYAYSMATRG